MPIIEDLFASVPGTRQDWKIDWKEDAKADWKVDWDNLPGDAPATAPANTVLPVISGTAEVGELLTVSNGTWTGNPAPTIEFSWLFSADGQPGSWAHTGQTANTFTPGAEHEGGFLFVQVSATNGVNGTVYAESASVGPIAAAV